jgi:hydroxymethylglutaryl-CoA reductase (NADPH)
MAAGENRIRLNAQRYLEGRDSDTFAQRLAPRPEPVAPRLPGGVRATPEAVARRWEALGHVSQEARAALADDATVAQGELFSKNIEYFIGTARLPIGVVGPLRVNGLFASGDYYVPLATTEAALVASYSRGSQLITDAGGCSVMLLNEGISRAPGFAFENIAKAGQFILWLTSHIDNLKKESESTTRHGSLIDVRITVEGNHVYINFEFRTGDASGQNMVTIATQAIFDFILRECPIKPSRAYVEANLSGDKKASSQAFILVRGRKVTAEVKLTANLVERRLHASVKQMIDYWRMSAIGGVLSGAIGTQGHYANGLAALFIATGQDAACVAEAAVGVTRFEETDDGSLYACVTLPNIVVGTVGGGTGLPTQRACLEILGLAGDGHAPALSELCAALALSGELSIIGALASGEFSRAHAKLARGKQSIGAGPPGAKKNA